jgi:hypothetical protein
MLHLKLHRLGAEDHRLPGEEGVDKEFPVERLKVVDLLSDTDEFHRDRARC